MRIARTFAAVVAAASAPVGCAPVIASGPTVSETREIAAVTTVVLAASGDLTITKGQPHLVIHASEAVLDRLTSEVDGEVLVLGTDPGPGITFGEVRYELSVPDLSAIELDGSGDVEWETVDGDRAEIRLSGSGDIDLAGATGELTIELDGSGDIDAGDLESRNASVTIDGAGDVAVSARDTLDVRISGSGRVSYTGDPSLVTDVSGSGEIVRE